MKTTICESNQVHNIRKLSSPLPNFGLLKFFENIENVEELLPLRNTLFIEGRFVEPLAKESKPNESDGLLVFLGDYICYISYSIEFLTGDKNLSASFASILYFKSSLIANFNFCIYPLLY